VEKVYYMTKLTKSIRVSEFNYKRLFSLAGRLQEIRGKKQTPDDAITYLFENQEEEKNG